jgi:hypothetical protein
MSKPDLGQGTASKKLLDPGRFPRTARFLEDPAAELALREFAAAIPWARDPGYRGIRADDELYLKSIADWTELILRAHERGEPYFSLSTAFDVAVMDGISPSSLALDELIRCNRPEGVRYRLLLQEATTIATGRPGESTPFDKTGWYDDGRMQTWAFVFRRGTEEVSGEG